VELPGSFGFFGAVAVGSAGRPLCARQETGRFRDGQPEETRT